MAMKNSVQSGVLFKCVHKTFRVTFLYPSSLEKKFAYLWLSKNVQPIKVMFEFCLISVDQQRSARVEDSYADSVWWEGTASVRESGTYQTKS